jgi:hypothetical protein
MKYNGTFLSGYEQRVRLVADALKAHSDLTEETAVKLAEHALHAIDSIPEKVR